MKNIKINKENIAAIDEIIRQAEGRSSVRQISAKLVMETADGITKRLGIPKKAMVGIVVYADPNAQKFPNAYKYTPESTHFTMEYRSGGWYLTDVERAPVNSPTKAYSVVLTETAKAAIIAACQTLGVYDI